ncbi:MAG: type II toxin-antitoxin system VapC family toxin, partial [Euryarchaeota archaeon]|nr:type II toxin-antitoxin system VapC family toxin [Euryarchaeota archaeon]
MKAVLDASVLIWGAGEADDAKAERARRVQLALGKVAELRAPMILVYEVGEWLRRNHGDRDGSMAAADGLLSHVALEVPTAERFERILSLAAALSLTFYDASYLAAVEGDDAVLVTEDRRLLTAAKTVVGPRRAFDIDEAYQFYVL